MAFTQITSAGFGLTTGTLVGVAASFSSTVSVGGTLTYEDVTNVDSVGLITARNGIEVTDKGVQVGTGATVDSAAANILTFLTNGGERLRIASDGKLSITGSTANMEYLRMGGNNDRGLRFSSSTGSSSVGVVHTINAPGDSGAQGEIVLQTNSAERLRITSGGNLLIGSDTGSVHGNRLLQVGKTDRSETYVSIVSSTSGESGLLFADTTTNDDGGYRGQIRYHHSDDSMNFRTAATERMRIDSSGNMGLGTASPSALLHISKQVNSGDVGLIIQNTGTSNNTVSIRLNKGSGTEPDHRIQNDTGGNLTFARGTDESSYTEQMRIASSGQVLINTSSPANSDTNIEVHDTSVPEFAFGRNDTSITAGNGLGRLRFYGNDSNGTFQECARISAEADGTHQTDDKATRLSLWTTEGGNSSPTERLRIHQQGHGEFYNGAVTRVVVADDVTVSGANQSVSGIPSWATKITIIFYRISLNGTSDFLVQLRAGSSDIDSNYNSVSTNHTGATVKTSTSGFIIANTNAGHKTSGRMVIERVGTDTKWVATHMVTQDSGPAPRMGAGDLSSYSGTISGIKLKDTGSSLLDNGTMTIIAEA